MTPQASEGGAYFSPRPMQWGRAGGLQFPKSSTWVQMLSSQTITDAHYFKCSEYSQLGVFLAGPYSSRISQMCPLYY